MKKLNRIVFLESPKQERDIEKKMFPQLFDLSNDELSSLKGGYDCDAVCYPSEWGSCSCHAGLNA